MQLCLRRRKDGEAAGYIGNKGLRIGSFRQVAQDAFQYIGEKEIDALHIDVIIILQSVAAF